MPLDDLKIAFSPDQALIELTGLHAFILSKRAHSQREQEHEQLPLNTETKHMENESLLFFSKLITGSFIFQSHRLLCEG